MKRGGMYQRDAKAMPGCIVALGALTIASYLVTMAVIGKAVSKVLS